MDTIRIILKIPKVKEKDQLNCEAEQEIIQEQRLQMVDLYDFQQAAAIKTLFLLIY